MHKQKNKNRNDKYIRKVETFRKEDLRFTKAAYREIADYGLSTEELLECLNKGECSGRKRKDGVIEKCLNKKGRVLKVVAAESWDYAGKKIVWAIIHIGEVKRK